MIFLEFKLFYKKYFFVSSLILLVLFPACSDSPTNIGEDLLRLDQINIRKLDSTIDSIYQNSKSIKKIIPLGNSPTLLLGKYQNQTAHILIAFTFTLPDSIKKAIKSDSLDVINSRGILNYNYLYGDKSAPFDYSIYEIQSDWSSTNFTSDSFPSLQYSTIDLSSNKIETDTLFYFNLNNNIVKNWLKHEVDSALAPNKGVLITPKPISNKIVGFVAFDPDFSKDTKIEVIVRKPGAYTDTLEAYVRFDVSVVTGEIQLDSNYITIQSSIAHRGVLYFDLSSLKKDNIINNAQLTLYIDTLKSKFGNNFKDELKAFIITDKDSLKYNTNNVFTLNRVGDKYIGNISGMVRYWHANNPNYGILIKSANEIAGLEKFMIKSSSYPILNQRPKLEIIYTKRN